MNPIFKIILKYGVTILLFRLLIGIIGVGIVNNFVPKNFTTIIYIILSLLVLFVCWLLTYNGTEKLSQYLTGRTKLAFAGYLIIIWPITLNIIFLIFGRSNEIWVEFLIMTIGMAGAYSASKKFAPK